MLSTPCGEGLVERGTPGDLLSARISWMLHAWKRRTGGGDGLGGNEVEVERTSPSDDDDDDDDDDDVEDDNEARRSSLSPSLCACPLPSSSFSALEAATMYPSYSSSVRTEKWEASA